MDEVFGEIEVEYAPLCEGHEIDAAYEFDAPQFFDFTLHETLLDDAEAEQWFDFAPSYPPSPFLLKMKWRNGNSVNMAAETEQVSNIEEGSTGLEHGKTQHLRKSSSTKAKDFSFMKPTASHLAKQKNSSEIHSPQSLRIQRQNSTSTDGQSTKRQKLEAGYLSKIARLKHQILFTHKKTKEGDRTDVNLASKSNVTIAKEPNLVTAQRAQRHNKSKTNAESDGSTQSSSEVLKARSLNKKILEGPAQILSKMKTPRPTEFQVFHLRTSERAKQNTSNNAGSTISNSETQDLKRTKSSVSSRQEKCKTNNKLSSKSERGVFRNIKVYPLEQNDKESLNEPPTELFSKLSLASEVKQASKSPSKEQPTSKHLKENRSWILASGA